MQVIIYVVLLKIEDFPVDLASIFLLKIQHECYDRFRRSLGATILQFILDTSVWDVSYLISKFDVRDSILAVKKVILMILLLMVAQWTARSLNARGLAFDSIRWQA